MHNFINTTLRGLSLALVFSASTAIWAPPALAAPDDNKAAADASESMPNRIVREGVVVEFAAVPSKDGGDGLIASDWADIMFRITDESTGEPITGRYPAAWMDLSKAWEAKGERPMTCDERVVTYLQGIVGIRPMIDLNAHFLLVLNADPSVSVIDPAVGITGITNLFAQINMDRPGADWVKTENQKRVFVTMPLANQVAVIDTSSFKVIQNVDAGQNPTRIEIQSDQRYLWVGNNDDEASKSGVSILDAVENEKVKFISTGAGHHEIVITDDDRHAFVSNRSDGTVSIIDVRKLEKIKDVKTGPVPIAVAYSSLSNAVYVADAKDGSITVIDAVSHEQRGKIQAEPGMGPMRFSQDGRWGVVVNPFKDKIHVIDAAKDQIIQNLTVGSKPYQVTFTRSFAYIRSLGTAQVGLLPLSQLDDPEKPQLTYIPAGQNAPGAAAQISISDSMVPSVKEAAAYIVNQAEGTVHYYMEGMGAPMGAFRNYGHQARAIEIVDRSLGENDPGVYVGQVKIPIEGTYDVAFMMDTPRFLHCFSAEVKPNPTVDSTTRRLSLDFSGSEKQVVAGNKAMIRFALADPRDGKRLENVRDISVMHYRADGRDRNVVWAKALGDGKYEAEITIRDEATYFVFVGSRSKDIKYTDLPFLSVKGIAAEDKDKSSTSK